MARTTSSKPKASRQGTDPVPPADLEGKDGRGSYKVGYCCPPQHSRFRPGQSGNPRGREKQSRNMRTIMKQVLNEDMQIREKGRIRRMPTFEALVRTTLNHAFKHDPKAMASLLVLIKHCGYGNDHDEPAAELLSGLDLKAIIDDFVDRSVPVNRTASETKTTGETPDTEPSASPTASPNKPT
jgi:Family of unknown function (DUF5681)